MKDPTRIPQLLDALQDLWEASPDLELADILRLLDSEGFANVDDAMAVDKLRALGKRFPRTLGEGVRVAAAGEWFITADEHRLAVWGRDHPPATWEYDRLVSAQVGYPLHVIDKQGEHRRFGVIERISPVPAQMMSQQELPNLRRSTIGDMVYLVICEDGGKFVIGRSLQCFEVGRRETTQQAWKWVSVSSARVGQDFHAELAAGAGEISKTNITAIYRLR
ncbi:hypothetical protein CKALI_10135 [Corynebacterium kalinowskii]|uniref:Uncharacterized protein n=1 Tax=Corynebacterium kalinowskii TaxID=2675216 RepID=A0A6B8VCK9_9CORY|nr:hypothetical protein [Corynebacterium kalinowskii]QGU02882.1 hypothetical protein CKALI_10135 [Corynebacterium kalinowskii]